MVNLVTAEEYAPLRLKPTRMIRVAMRQTDRPEGDVTFGEFLRVSKEKLPVPTE